MGLLCGSRTSWSVVKRRSMFKFNMEGIEGSLYRVLCSLAPKQHGHTMKWFSDNQNVTRIVHSSS